MLGAVAAAQGEGTPFPKARVAAIDQKTPRSIRRAFGCGRLIIDRERGSIRQPQDLSVACGPI
ncbi:MAG: hypothetical protein ACO394_00300 [Blastocatellia bacterium]